MYSLAAISNAQNKGEQANDSFRSGLSVTGVDNFFAETTTPIALPT